MFEGEHEDHLKNLFFCNSISTPVTNMFVEVDAPCLSQPANSSKSLQVKFYSLAFPNNTPEDWLLRVCHVFPPQVYWRLEGSFCAMASWNVLLFTSLTSFWICAGLGVDLLFAGGSERATRRKHRNENRMIRYTGYNSLYIFNRPANFVRSVFWLKNLQAAVLLFDHFYLMGGCAYDIYMYVLDAPVARGCGEKYRPAIWWRLSRCCHETKMTGKKKLKMVRLVG